ncbi:MAG: hypothetical protein OXE95_06815 [Chloroflexi bacterium]|nr:hypothetical protein [Chloroflexota bacterium]MCY4247270.1 hypothetical protein [Chloroflexota bacterium]
MSASALSANLREDAQLVIDVIGEKEAVTLDYSAESVRWLDSYIARHRGELDAGDKSLLQEKFGAYLGESIRHNYGGCWARARNGEWMIEFDERHQASPFALIAEHLDHHTALAQTFASLPRLALQRQN